MMIRIALSVLLVFGSLGCSDTSSPDRQIKQPLAYLNDPDSRFSTGAQDQDVFILDIRSGESWRLTDNGVREFSIGWSPSGTHLIYIADLGGSPYRVGNSRDGNRQVVTHNIHTGSTQVLDLKWAQTNNETAPEEELNGPWIHRVASSPTDSTKLAAVVTLRSSSLHNSSKKRLVLFDQEKKTSRLLSEKQTDDVPIYWSCDSRWIAVEDSRPARFQIVNVISGETRMLRPPDSVSGIPESYKPKGWTPDGRMLVQGETKDNSQSFVYTVEMESNQWEKLAHFHKNIWQVQALSRDDSGQTTDLVLLSTFENMAKVDITLYDLETEEVSFLTKDRGYKMEISTYRSGCRPGVSTNTRAR